MKKVLIAEDQGIVSLDLATLAKIIGFNVIRANSGKDAYEKFEREKPDVVLMDVDMETRTAGIETAREMLKKKNIPIIFITAYSDPETLTQILKLNSGGYICKPYSDNEVIRRLSMYYS